MRNNDRRYISLVFPGWPPSLGVAGGKVAELVMLLSLTYAFRRLLDRRDFASPGFRRDRNRVLDILMGLGLGGVQMLVIFGAEWVSGWLSVELLDGAALARPLAQKGDSSVPWRFWRRSPSFGCGDVGGRCA